MTKKRKHARQQKINGSDSSSGVNKKRQKTSEGNVMSRDDMDPNSAGNGQTSPVFEPPQASSLISSIFGSKGTEYQPSKTDAPRQGSSGSLMSSIFGNRGAQEDEQKESSTAKKKKKKKGKDSVVAEQSASSSQIDLFSNNSSRFQQVSQKRQQEILEKQQRALSSATSHMPSSKQPSPDTVLNRRRKRTNNTVELVASVTVDVPQYYCEDLPSDQEGSDREEEDDMEGVARLLVGRSSALFRDRGVIILKSLLSQPSKSDVPKKKKNSIHHSPLMKEMQSKAQEVEQQICQRLNEKLGEDSYRPPPKGIKKSMDANKDTSFRFVEVASRCLGRLDIRYGMNGPPFTNLHLPCELRDNPVYAAANHKVYDNNVVKLLWPLVQDLLGKDAELEYMGLICSFPGSEDQPWHQDGTKLFPDAPSDLINSLPPYALNVFIPLLNVTEELGPTEFWLGSHSTDQAHEFLSTGQHHGRDPDDGDDDDGKAPIIGPLLSVGDALIYDYRICHRGTSNLSKKTRPMLYLMYARPWFKEHLNFGSEHLFDAK